MRSSIKANISFNNIYTRAGKGLDTPTCVLFNQVIETNKLHKWKLTKNTQNYLAFICISAKFCTQLCPRLKLWKTTVYNYITYYLFHLTGQLWSPPRERQKSLLLKHVIYRHRWDAKSVLPKNRSGSKIVANCQMISFGGINNGWQVHHPVMGKNLVF